MEEKLKKVTKDISIDTIIVCSFYFVCSYIDTYKLIDKNLFVKILIGVIFACLILGFISGRKSKEREAELLSVMPMIISIKDTTQSLKEEKILYSTLALLMFVIGFFMTDSSPQPFNIVFILIASLSFIPLQLTQLTDKKLKYLESKPEGL